MSFLVEEVTAVPFWQQITSDTGRIKHPCNEINSVNILPCSPGRPKWQ